MNHLSCRNMQASLQTTSLIFYIVQIIKSLATKTVRLTLGLKQNNNLRILIIGTCKSGWSFVKCKGKAVLCENVCLQIHRFNLKQNCLGVENYLLMNLYKTMFNVCYLHKTIVSACFFRYFSAIGLVIKQISAVSFVLWSILKTNNINLKIK